MSNINLLPPQIKDSIEQRKKNSVIRRILLRSIWLFGLTIGLAVVTWIFLDYSGRNVDEELIRKEEAISQFGGLENKAKKASEKITSVKKIENGLNHWEDIIAEIQKVMPAGSYLSRASLNAETKTRATMTGFAKTKENIASLRDALERSDYFEYADIDSATTQSDPRNGTVVEAFTISFSLEKGALDE